MSRFKNSKFLAINCVFDVILYMNIYGRPRFNISDVFVKFYFIFFIILCFT